MRKVIFLFVVVLSSICAQAQTATTNAPLASAGGSNEASAVGSADMAPKASVSSTPDIFGQTIMQVSNGKAMFKNLPDVTYVTAYISNASGQVIMTRELDVEKGRLDISDVPAGLHYITLTTGSKSRKAFILHND